MNNGTRRYGVTYFTTQPQYTLPSGDSTAVLYLIATYSTVSFLNRGSTGSAHTATEQLYLTDCLIDSPSQQLPAAVSPAVPCAAAALAAGVCHRRLARSARYTAALCSAPSSARMRGQAPGHHGARQPIESSATCSAGHGAPSQRR